MFSLLAQQFILTASPSQPITRFWSIQNVVIKWNRRLSWLFFFVMFSCGFPSFHNFFFIHDSRITPLPIPHRDLCEHYCGASAVQHITLHPPPPPPSLSLSLSLSLFSSLSVFPHLSFFSPSVSITFLSLLIRLFLPNSLSLYLSSSYPPPSLSLSLSLSLCLCRSQILKQRLSCQVDGLYQTMDPVLLHTHGYIC